jgi:hypothetical protein
LKNIEFKLIGNIFNFDFETFFKIFLGCFNRKTIFVLLLQSNLPQMKKILSLLILVFAFSSCEDDVTFNNPSVQGLMDNVIWRAIDFRATVNANGALKIEAFTQNQVLTLQTPSRNVGVYNLGENSARSASFTTEFDDIELLYTTGVDIGGNGQIVINNYDAAAGTVSGTFRFNAINVNQNPLGEEVLNFQKGVFYNVKVSNGQ